jgi:hypothetical protein
MIKMVKCTGLKKSNFLLGGYTLNLHGQGCGFASLKCRPDPSSQLNSDPDSTAQINTDPDFHRSEANLKSLVYRPSKAPFLASTPPF